ncbi:50S ribosomal protein L32 [Candidatus Shikimatogenerans bostrichidophilus]|uniref:50S ribosomal protein L32 n=1 Tax=Candidatus Shikimatogenerans bostrichidophilus TaxID=2943807 RepID=UPI002967256B
MAHPKKKTSISKKKLRRAGNINKFLFPLFFNKKLNKYQKYHNVIIKKNIIYYKNKIYKNIL